MFKLKQKTKTASLSLALAAAMTGGVMMGTSTSVQAVNIAQDGIGEVLLFPYYTVRGGWQSYFNVTNTSNHTIIVRVRWHEGVNSRDVRDFNITMSPYDVWTAAVVPTDDGEGAKIVTSDKTCTAPALNDADGGRPGVLKGKAFTNLAYAGANGDHGPATMDRTKEGYFTVISMGVAKNELVQTAIDATHVTVAGNDNKAVPFDCANIVRRSSSSNIADLATEFNEPQNLIKGRAILINAATGIAMGYDPTVLANFYNPDLLTLKDGFSSETLIDVPSSDEPNLNFAFPTEATWIDDTPGVGPVLATVSASEAASNGIGSGRPVDAVSVLFNRAAIVNDYNIAGGSATDWVVTLPTKRYYVDEQNSVFAAGKVEDIFPAPLQPFDDAVSGEEFGRGVELGLRAEGEGQSCFDVNMRIWDREEGEFSIDAGLAFSPAPPGALSDQFCYETNIISFGDQKDSSSVVNSKLAKFFSKLPGDYGWGQLEFGAAGGESLPVIGLRLETRKKERNPGSSYGFANAHAYKRNVQAYMDDIGPSN